jgi:hypothetical protein
MSCKETDRPDVLVYLRRTAGGDTAIYSWDYYLMSSLPTNDNVRYSRPENYETDKNNTPLHEIGNNRYEDVVCKSTHLAYRIGGFAKRTAIPTGEAKNLVDKQYETDANQCVLLFTSSSNFYQRTPECWPWSCRRWTREIKAKRDKNGNFALDKETKKRILESDTCYREDSYGNKVPVSYESLPNLMLFNPFFEKIPIYKLTINEMGDDYQVNNPQGPKFYGHYTTRLGVAVDPDETALSSTGCPQGTDSIYIVFEIFPVLCKGTCSLIIKFGYICSTGLLGLSNPTQGRIMKRVISPFNACMMEEDLSVFNMDNPESLNPTAKMNPYITLSAIEDLLTEKPEKWDDVTPKPETGQNFDVRTDPETKKLAPYYWNLSDPPTRRVDYYSKGTENVGSANKFIDAQSSCCKKCKKVDPVTKKVTYFDNPFCYELDKECYGGSYDPNLKIDGSC